MATVNYLYRSTRPQSFLTVRLLFRKEGKDYSFEAKTNILVTSEYWKKYHLKKNLKSKELLKMQIECFKKINALRLYIFNSIDVEADFVSKQTFRQLISEFYRPVSKEQVIPKELVRFLDYYMVHKKEEMNLASINKARSIQRKLKAIEKSIGKQILIKEVGESFKQEFVAYGMRNNYAKNTIQKDFTFIKTYCKYARYLGLEVHPQIDLVKVAKEKISSIYLSFDELKAIINLDSSILNDKLENVRDWLIISCYTGQRVSDFMRFHSSMLYENNGSFIAFKQVKTQKDMLIPLLPDVKNIIDARDGEFPKPISAQKYNTYVKELCMIAGLHQKVNGAKTINLGLEKKPQYRKVKGVYRKWELVTSHIGRRSFATNFYGKIPTVHLMHITGHSTEKMFLSYIGKGSSEIAKESLKYFNHCLH